MTIDYSKIENLPPPENINVEKFKEELLENLEAFVKNMESHNKCCGDITTTFPEWYETFMAWLEVGTDMEYSYYGTREHLDKTIDNWYLKDPMLDC